MIHTPELAKRAVDTGPGSGNDPLLYGAPLPFRRRYYPLGFPIDVETDAEEILRATSEIWGEFESCWNAVPLTMRFCVEDRATTAPRTPVSTRGQGHLISIVQGPDNFATCDLTRGVAYSWLTRDVAADAIWFRYHFLEPLAYLMLAGLYVTVVHAACVARNGRAVILCGDSGAGKTTLAYACARSGWTYLSDDAVHIMRDREDHLVMGRPYWIRFRETAQCLFPELSGAPVIRRPNNLLNIEARTSTLQLGTTQQARACAIVFLGRQHGADPILRPHPVDEARRYFHQFLCFGDEWLRAGHRRTIERILELPLLHLTYDDLNGAERVLADICR